jgi:NAD(P)-dependent dehydrogenase (short-subunit alcohol dehydrogenase family)
MKIVVITGSTRGLGYGLADAFLGLGCAVTISGRAQAAIDPLVARLSVKHEARRVFGYPCDVTDYGQLQALWNAAKARFGRIDIWINNAGIAHPISDFAEMPPGQLQAIVTTNLLGAMYGSRVALTGMREQGFGSLYNMEGLGSSGGRRVRGLALYGTTKAALRYLDDALAQETKGTPLIVGALQPGMTVTDMLTRQYEGRPEEWEKFKPILNIIADRVEIVTPWLAQKVLANTQTGARFAFSSSRKVLWRFLTAPFIRRKVVD